MILESVILFRIEHFEQCRTRVAAKISTELVNFVKQQHGINSARLFHHLNDLAGQRPDVSATMTANLSFVANTTQRQANKLAPGSSRDRLTETRFADSRRADKTENRTLWILYQLTDGQDIREYVP